MGSVHRRRDLFPAPRFPSSPLKQGAAVSRGVRQRLTYTVKLREESNATFQTLDELYRVPQGGGSVPSVAPRRPRDGDQPLPAAIIALRERVFKYHQDVQPPPGGLPSPEAAARGLLGSDAGAYAPVASQLRSYVRAPVALPEENALADNLKGLSPEAAAYWKGPPKMMMLSEEESAGVAEASPTFRPYVRPVLKGGPRKYAKFIADMLKADVAFLSTYRKAAVTPFFVAKKDGRLRLAIDARLPNARVRKAPAVALAPISALAEIELPEQDILHISQNGVRDFFYRLALPKEIGVHFGLPPVDTGLLAQELGTTFWGGHCLLEHRTMSPCLKAVPMGWSWAMDFAQDYHLTTVSKAPSEGGLHPIPDRRRAPVLTRENTCFLPYADNGSIHSIDAKVNNGDRHVARSALVKEGRLTREEVDAEDIGNLLGVAFDGQTGSILPTSLRYWRIVQAPRLLEKRPRVAGRQLERIVGHITFVLPPQPSRTPHSVQSI